MANRTPHHSPPSVGSAPAHWCGSSRSRARVASLAPTISAPAPVAAPAQPRVGADRGGRAVSIQGRRDLLVCGVRGGRVRARGDAPALMRTGPRHRSREPNRREGHAKMAPAVVVDRRRKLAGPPIPRPPPRSLDEVEACPVCSRAGAHGPPGRRAEPGPGSQARMFKPASQRGECTSPQQFSMDVSGAR